MGRKAVKNLFQGILSLIYIIIVILTIIARFASLCPPEDYPITSYLGTLLPGLLLVHLIFLFFWLIRRKKMLYLTLFTLVVNYSYISSVIQLNSSEEYRSSDFTIASYNVHGFNSDGMGITQRNILADLKEKEVDILCFQEFYSNQYFTLDSLHELFKAYPYHLIPSENGGRRDLAIISKFPIVDSLYIPFEHSSNSGLRADIRVNHQIVRVYNLHLETTDVSRFQYKMSNQKTLGLAHRKRTLMVEMHKGIIAKNIQRSQQAKLINEQIKNTTMPIILCGDFNATPASYTYRLLKENLIDGFKTSGSGYGGTYRHFLHLLRIDYIFYSPHFEGIDYHSPNLRYSDHKPVIQRLNYKTQKN
jgi:endonuclease/exonuclease/phosphatase family metal-dependent hydrolase